MRIPQSPPEIKKLIVTEPNLFEKIAPILTGPAQEKYIHWDKLRHLSPPHALTHEEWWAAMTLRMIRRDGICWTSKRQIC